MKDIDWNLIKVLVVDDDEILLKTIDKYIKTIGCTGAYAKNGEEAVEFASRYNFDLCFMDLLMPKMGGVAATQILREKINATFPIIALTSSTMKADKEKCRDIGMQDYINKPVSLKLVKDIISTYGIKNEI